MLRLYADNAAILAGLAAAVFILAGRLWIGAPFAAAFLIGLALFVGLYLIGSFLDDFMDRREARLMTGADIRRRIKDGLDKVKTIRRQARNIDHPEVRAKVENVADLADRILHNLLNDPEDQAKAGRFLLYLDRFLPLIERYAALSSTPEGREMLKKSKDEDEFLELLDTAETSFKRGLENYLQNDAMELRMLGRTLKKMMNVAEIGK
jgi:5-bromo-4-chloroindolyl phosphate hydrolysis protein